MISGAQLGNHLWQSTIVWLVLWSLMPFLQNQRAVIRSRLWLAASLKFLLPFAVLSWAAGTIGHFHTPSVKSVSPSIVVPVRRVEMPFTDEHIVDSTSSSHSESSVITRPIFLSIIIGIWILGVVSVLFPWFFHAHRLKGIVLGGTGVGTIGRVSVVSLESAIEPSVFGLFRSVILLPAGIEQRLNEEQMGSILVHELHHAYRYDNLQYAMHTFVSSLFWFHPAVWVIRRQILREREFACDEAVLAGGRSPVLYADTLLTVCRWRFEEKIAYAAGMRSGELNERVLRILNGEPKDPLGLWKTVAICLIGLAAISLPAGLGLVEAQSTESHAQQPSLDAFPGHVTYDLSKVSLHDPSDNSMRWNNPNGKLTASGVTLRDLIADAWGLRPDQVSGGAEWVNEQRWDVTARMTNANEATLRAMTKTQRELMNQALLTDRFHVRVHTETREGIVLNLLPAPKGIRMTAVPPPSPVGWLGEGKVPEGGVTIRGGSGGSLVMIARGMGIGTLASNIALNLNQSVIDRTEIPSDARFAFKLRWKSGSTQESEGKQLPIALEEQLGLRLHASRGFAQLVEIDRADKPVTN